jgi:flagellar hook-associated protein 1 FlgK
MDRRDQALGTLATLTGATTRMNTDGTVDVSIGGNAIVSGVTARSLRVAGTNDLSTAGTDPVHLEWADTGRTAAVDGGEVAARLSTLAGPAAGGSGGVYAEAAKVYNDLATSIATQVNALHEQGSTTSGATGLDFFRLGTAGPAALNLSVVPTDATGIAAADPAKGAADGSIADAISQLGSASGSPDASWAAFVSRIGVQSQSATAQSSLADSASNAATTAQTSESGVDLDEETANLVTFQHAYQAAARVLTTVDSMLDTIINKMGIGA